MSQALFDHMSSEYGLTLLESEMDEISRIVADGLEAQLRSALNERDQYYKYVQNANQQFAVERARVQVFANAFQKIRDELGRSTHGVIRDIIDHALNWKPEP